MLYNDKINRFLINLLNLSSFFRSEEISLSLSFSLSCYKKLYYKSSLFSYILRGVALSISYTILNFLAKLF